MAAKRAKPQRSSASAADRDVVPRKSVEEVCHSYPNTPVLVFMPSSEHYLAMLSPTWAEKQPAPATGSALQQFQAEVNKVECGGATMIGQWLGKQASVMRRNVKPAQAMWVNPRTPVAASAGSSNAGPSALALSTHQDGNQHVEGASAAARSE